MTLIIVLALLIGVYWIKNNNNEDIIKENCKSKEDLANINNAKKVYSKTKISTTLLILTFTSLIIILLANFTDIDRAIIDYFSNEFYYEEEGFNYYLYLLPIYIYISRIILNEVKLGEFLLKYFKVDEPVLEENIIKTLLYKKKITNKKSPKETQSEQITKEEKPDNN